MSIIRNALLVHIICYINTGSLRKLTIAANADKNKMVINALIDKKSGNRLNLCSIAVSRLKTSGIQHIEVIRKKVQNKPSLSNTVCRLKRDISMTKMIIIIILKDSITM